MVLRAGSQRTRIWFGAASGRNWTENRWKLRGTERPVYLRREFVNIYKNEGKEDETGGIDDQVRRPIKNSGGAATLQDVIVVQVREIVKLLAMDIVVEVDMFCCLQRTYGVSRIRQRMNFRGWREFPRKLHVWNIHNARLDPHWTWYCHFISKLTEEKWVQMIILQGIHGEKIYLFMVLLLPSFLLFQVSVLIFLTFLTSWVKGLQYFYATDLLKFLMVA